MSDPKPGDVWVCDRHLFGVTVDELVELIHRDSSAALWNWQHQSAGVRDPGNELIVCQDSPPARESAG